MMEINSKAGAILLTLLLLCARPSAADLIVVREVAIGPKTVHAAANIGAVNSSPNVRLEKAVIDITVGRPFVDNSGKPLLIAVRGTFLLVNQSDQQLELTVGFPVSNSEYSAYALEAFRVATDMKTREVFRRKSGYPRRLTHEYISGMKGPGSAKPPNDVYESTMHLFGRQQMGKDELHNLMVWQERFSPYQEKSVKVEYEFTLPLQEAEVLRKKVKGNHKSVWPQEANNVPPAFVESLPDKSYYFFDYYLTSGASWAGTIGVEEILMSFDQWWYDVEFYTTIDIDELAWAPRKAKPADPIWMYYVIEDMDPSENLYFAIRPYGIEDELAGRQAGQRKNVVREPGLEDGYRGGQEKHE